MAAMSVSGLTSTARPHRWIALAALLALTPAAAPALPTGSLQIDVSGVRSAKGMIRVCLTADPKNFPGCVDDKDAITRSVPAGQRVIRFDGLAQGRYAAALIHDENSNAKLDTLLGIPREGFGFSRNPPIGFGPPKFTAAEFTLDGVAETQQVRMRYML